MSRIPRFYSPLPAGEELILRDEEHQHLARARRLEQLGLVVGVGGARERRERSSSRNKVDEGKSSNVVVCSSIRPCFPS